MNAPDARSGIALRCAHRGPDAAANSLRHFLIAAYWRADLLWFAMPIAGRCTALRRSAWACRLRLNFPMAASRRALKTARSTGHPLHPVKRAAALAAPDKATCFNFSVSAIICPGSTATHSLAIEAIKEHSDYPFMIANESSAVDLKFLQFNRKFS